MAATEILIEKTWLISDASSVFLWEKITKENLPSELIVALILDTSSDPNGFYSCTHISFVC